MIRTNVILNGLNCSRTFVPSLSISPTSVLIDYTGAAEIVGVDVADATQVWAYEISESWIHVASASLIGDDPLVHISCDENTDIVQRVGYVTFTSNSCANAVLTVTQDSYV